MPFPTSNSRSAISALKPSRQRDSALARQACLMTFSNTWAISDVLLPQELIARKRDGHSLEAQQIRDFVLGITDGSVADEQLGAFAMAVRLNGMTPAETAALTISMRDSGRVIDWADLPGPVLDKHSTGGVGDTVSLILGPWVAACGGFVPMISGRGLGHTGGTLDKLAAIPGYDPFPDPGRLSRIVREIGVAIIGQ